MPDRITLLNQDVGATLKTFRLSAHQAGWRPDNLVVRCGVPRKEIEVDHWIRPKAAAGFVVAMALALAGCGGGGEPAPPGGSSSGDAAKKSQMTIGAVYLDTQGFYAGVKKGVGLEASESGVEVKFVETNTQGDVSKESEFVQTLISSQADAILLSAASAKASVPALRSAHNEGVPVICYNTCIAPEEAGQYVYGYAYGDPTEFGYQTGKAAAEYFKAEKIDSPTIGVLNCEFVEVCVNRRKGFEKALTELVPGYELVANQEGTDPEKSIGVAENILTANPELDAFYGESGGAATGAVKAVQNAGRTGKTVVFGSDMTVDLAKALVDGKILKASIDVSGTAVGRAAMKAAIAAVNGEKPAAVDIPVPIDVYTTADQGNEWLTTHADGIP